MRNIGFFLSLVILIVSGFLFTPLIRAYLIFQTTQFWKLDYQISSSASDSSLSSTKFLYPPKASHFWLAIPKLAHISPVRESIDFQNASAVKDALASNFVLHSINSVTPGQWGTMVISAHHPTSDNSPRINSAYYLARYLSPGDSIVVGFQNQRFTYQITSIETVENYPNIPPDSALQRLVILASYPFIPGSKIQINAVLQSSK